MFLQTPSNLSSPTFPQKDMFLQTPSNLSSLKKTFLQTPSNLPTPTLPKKDMFLQTPINLQPFSLPQKDVSLNALISAHTYSP